jgi:hypothetical protein
MLKVLLDQMAIWINPLWILLGGALGLHGLRKTMSRTMMVFYIFATCALAILSARASLQQDQERKSLEVTRNKFEKQQAAQQREIFAEQQSFSRKQADMADDLKRLAELERRNSALAQVTARIINVNDPDIQLINASSVEAHDVFWQVVLWNLDSQTGQLLQPLSIPTQIVQFLKAHTRPLPTNLFGGHGINPNVGDRIFGFAAVDCSNCGSSLSFWIYFRYAQKGWVAAIPPGSPVSLGFLFNNLKDFKAQPNDNWLDLIAPTNARHAIETLTNATF